ncbi:MAG: hypothetical protein HYX51_01880 [Chloroflexi bacterium]|nr:hypothetical protein [Chloroflexota bacterium]
MTTDERRADLFESRSAELDAAIERAIANAIEEHRRAGNPIAVWRDGTVVWIPADQIVPLPTPERPENS